MTYEVSSRRAQRVVRFIEEFLVVPEGKDVGKPVRLRDWQLEFIDEIYGTPTRRAIPSMGRKNGKSAITAMLLLAHLVGPGARRNSQVYSAAQSRDQAALVFGLAAKQAGSHVAGPELAAAGRTLALRAASARAVAQQPGRAGPPPDQAPNRADARVSELLDRAVRPGRRGGHSDALAKGQVRAVGLWSILGDEGQAAACSSLA